MGLGHKSLKTIYEGAVIPMLTYGVPVWEEVIRKKKNLQNLHRVQRLINLKVSKAYRTLSYEASCVMAGVMPIELIIDEQVNLYKIKNGISRLQYDCDLPTPVKDWPHPAERQKITFTNNLTTYSFQIFTDGSKTEEKVGSGVAIYKDNNLIKQYKYRLQTHCSSNQAEKIAILKALENIQFLPKFNDYNNTAAIYTDSKVTLDSIDNNHIHCTLSSKIRESLRHLHEKNWTVGHFGWVKAHIGIEGNETADKLAKAAAADSQLNIVYDKIPISTICTEQRKRSLSTWQNLWENTGNGSQCRTFFPNVEQRLKRKIPISPEFTALVKGHGKTNSYLHRFKFLDNPPYPGNKEHQNTEN